MDKILFVDDEPEELQGFCRVLRNKFKVYTAATGIEGLKMLEYEGPFSVIVCDMKMPNMNGIEFFSQTKDIAPDSTRIMLTGASDLQATINAINEGKVYQFLTKPCNNETLKAAIDSGITQYKKIVAERKKKEEELKRLSVAIDQASDSIFITDAEGTIVYINPALECLSGFFKDEIIGKTPNIFKSETYDESFYKKFWHTIKKGEIWKGHLINRKKDGTLYEIDASISPVRDSNGIITHFISTSRDVTYEVKLEAQLRHAQKMETICMIAGGITHNFNNILTVILGYSQIALIKLKPDNEFYEYFDVIHSAGLEAKEMANDIFSFMHKVERKKKLIDIYPIVEDVLKLIKGIIPSSIRIEQNISKESGQSIGDSSQIHQVVMNLCTNACHAMKNSNGTLSVTVDRRNMEETKDQNGTIIESGNYIRIIVRDTGIGMDKETLERIFLPFFTTKKEGEGTGLGLFTVKSILKEHDGIITVTSQPGKGTEFIIYLPSAAETSL